MQLGLDLDQGQIALLANPVDHLTFNFGSNPPLAARAMPHPLGLTAALASGRYLPPPGNAYSKTLGQLGDRPLATIQRGKKLTPQIIIVGFRHTQFVAEFARTATIHYLWKCSKTEVLDMLKKSIVALFGLLFAMALITPPKANAAVAVGIGVGPAYVGVGRPYVRPYAYAAPAPIVPAPYVAYAPGYVYPAVYPTVAVGYGRGYRYYGHYGYGWRR